MTLQKSEILTRGFIYINLIGGFTMNKSLTALVFRNGMNIAVGESTLKTATELAKRLSELPAIKRVDVLPNDDNPRTVIVEFVDGDIQKAKTSGGDIFNLETGITICVAKHMLNLFDGRGSARLNNAVKRGIKCYERCKADRIAAEELAKQRAERAQRKHEKRIAKREAADLAFKEEMIEIQKEAYLRAMRELDTGDKKPDSAEDNKSDTTTTKSNE